MSKNIFFVSDTHFSHANILTFTSAPGDLVRPGFKDVSHMDEVLIENWNKVVKPSDHVYHLGDVCFGKKEDFDKILSRLNGKKRLVVGNHDNPKNPAILKHFQKIMLWRIFKDEGFLCSHVPIFSENIRKVDFNVHGHIHEKPDMSDRHLNICVEKTNFTPLHMDEVIKRLRAK